ncbi:imidazolonepropionase [Dethiosulfovibrio peptidovorans DSM 11002]|uniref:Imidazolonepropionase n=1 Tax=Dethiosulfovibrio peptidovorans DSM 11002 TaxID=469381 RepID=D2Z7Y8_9BACT|nr:imidazolonepropionase [Dethiosulfovibrio peptidovorans]EFC91585.1 imidazolonepropionase [Dethiosulfovibrio peptidovorans DSM 11002]
MMATLFRNARITTPIGGDAPLAGSDQGRVATYEKGALLCENGLIAAIGDEKDILIKAEEMDVDMEVDCEGTCMIPGFVDPHTHICFAKRRENEFSMRLAGTPYLEILKAGGGILSSVRSVHEATEDELFETTLDNVLSALNFGTTTLEIKSGYGLTTESELKMLSVIGRIARETPLDIAPTFMGAHAVPTEYKGNPDKFVDIMVEEMLPAVKEQGIAKYCDVFCEEGVFTVDQSRRILEKARDLGFLLRIHADEVHDTGGAGLAAELGTVSAEHLLAANEKNLRSMAVNGVIADVLPATAYSLKKPYAPVRKMIDLGVPVALATDCNPGSCFTESIPFVFGLGVMNMDMTVEEALVATTLNPAWSLGLQDKVGSLEVGKQADFLLLDGESPAILAYHAGVSPVVEVYKKGVQVA